MELLKKYEGQLLEISDINDLDKFSVGYIVAEDEKNIIIESFSTLGFFSGYDLIKKENIGRISVGTEYLKGMKKLMVENSLENIQNSFIFKNKKIDKFDNNDLIIDLLKKAKENKSIVEINTINDDNYLGYVIGFDDDFVEFQNYEDESIDNLHFNIIKNISIDDVYFKKKEFMYK